MNRGFIQIPILVTILVGIAVLGATGYMAYEAGQKSSVKTEVKITETTSEDSVRGVTKIPNTSTKLVSSPVKNLTAPVNDNLNSTCLSFYEKMKSLGALPAKETPVYTQAELKAIEMAGKGEYDPALPNAQAKMSEVEINYQNAIRANLALKQDLLTKYAFCYEYLAKKYGFIID